MKNTIILLLLLSYAIVDAKEAHTQYSASVVPPHMSVKEKKARFYALVVPPIQTVYEKLYSEYSGVKAVLQSGKKLTQAQHKVITILKKRYNVKSDTELLKALKPHPPSIAIAQAAMESAWGTSRFFREANNIFGMWNNNKNAKRIAASQKRGGKHTVWLSKYDSLEGSVSAYYKTLAKGKLYKKFREVRYHSDDVYLILKELNHYSERKEAYTQELASMIRYNKLTRYDKQ